MFMYCTHCKCVYVCILAECATFYVKLTLLPHSQHYYIPSRASLSNLVAV